MRLDFEYEVRTNPEFRNGLQQRLQRWAYLHSVAITTQTFSQQYQSALWDLVRYSNLNLAFLSPFYWPQYPGSKPLSFAAFPYAFQMFEVQVGGYSVFRGSRQIAKSTSFCCRQLLLARMLAGFRSLYIVPRNQQLETYQYKLREVERAMVDFQPKGKSLLTKILRYKEFSNGSAVELAYVLTSASNIRGKSTDELLFDEAQDFDPDLELEVLQTQSASIHPITIYAGTSLTTDTLLEMRWSESSQGLWIIKCPHCNFDNIPLPEYRVLDMIQRVGPCCAKCGKLLNVRSGKFIHAYPERLKIGRRGFHIPQIIVPSVIENPIRWAKIYELKLKRAGDRKFLQEILGIAVEQGEREITRQQLIDICVLGKDLQSLLQQARQRKYEFVVSGCDWGGSDYVPALHTKLSTTVHVIMGVLPGEGQLDILHMYRYSGMNYDDITNDILANHALFNGFALASDFGVGAVYNSKIREKVPPEKHLIFNYYGPVGDLIMEPKKSHMFNQWSLNKTESISMTFDAIRHKRIRCFSWDIAEEYLVDCLNLYRAPGERTGAGGAGAGNSTFLYRAHPTRPNDTLMAINYAYMLSRILLGEPMFADLSLKVRLENTLCSSLSSIYGNLPGAFSG